MTKQEARDMLSAHMSQFDGRVKRIATGQTALGLTARDWREVVTGVTVAELLGKRDEDALIRQRRVTVGHGGRQYVTNGLGERLS